MRRVAVGLMLLFFLAPLAWQVVVSVTPGDQPLSDALRTITTDHYRAVFTEHPFLRIIANSFLVAAGTTLASIVVGAPAAFALAKLSFRGRSALLAGSLAISMFPPIATVSPQYLLLRALGLRDTLVGLMLPYTTFSLPLALWLLSSVFRDLPDELYRAARIDGCTPFQAFRRVLLPLAAPGLATTSILVFIFAWNEFLYALTFITTPVKRTVPVAIALFASEHRDPLGDVAAASILASVPLVFLTILFQRRIVSGLTSGAVKG